MTDVQPFHPFLIVALFTLGIGLAVVAVLRQPGAPLLPTGSNTAQVLEPMKLNDTANLKLYNN